MTARTSLALAVTLLAALTLAGSAPGSPTAKSKPKAAPTGQQLGGTWITTIELVNAPPGIEPRFQALNTFLGSGELVVSSSQPNPGLRVLAHGQWVRTGNRRFASTMLWFRFDPTGKYIGMQRVRRTIELAASLTRFTSEDVIEVLTPDGVVVASINGRETGTRLGT